MARKELFGSWAKPYDASLEHPAGFPFEGYEEVLAGVVGGSAVGRGGHVLDIGTGTGALAARFVARECHVLGVDTSEAMLVRARNNVPEAQFAPLELLESWDALNGWRFDAVVSSYLLHAFDWPTKTRLLGRMAALLEPGGCLVMGDISFETAAALESAHTEWKSVWKEGEHYWVADEAIPRLLEAGFKVQYRQVSFCGGIYILTANA